mmetsp:Transcript_21091/g.30397  ORF Transcript_21091/g.30397 Transcript_21091/m.30397 type:complete len:152 (+) Transcript_21091:120-575(+)
MSWYVKPMYRFPKIVGSSSLALHTHLCFFPSFPRFSKRRMPATQHTDHSLRESGGQHPDNIPHNEFVVDQRKFFIPLAQILSNLGFPLSPLRRMFNTAPCPGEPIGVAQASAGDHHIQGDLNDLVDDFCGFDLWDRKERVRKKEKVKVEYT